MTHCPHCGAEVQDTAKFCAYCGQPLAAPQAAPFTPPAPPEQPQPPKKRPPLRALAAVLAVLVVALGVVIALILLRHNGVRSYDDCMALAARYLEELDFEQAEAMYLEAIQLDPSQVEAYRALAELYISQERFEDALDILERGIAATGSEELQEMYDELRARLAPEEAEEAPDVIDYLDDPTALVSLLNMQAAESWQFAGEGSSYAADGFQLEYMDSIWSIRNERPSTVTLYGVTMDGSFSTLESTLLSHGWTQRGSAEAYLFYSGGIAIYAMEVQSDGSGGIESWFLCNWPEGDDLYDDSPAENTEPLSDGWKDVYLAYIQGYAPSSGWDYEFYLLQLGGDGIPELVIESNMTAAGDVLATCDGSQVDFVQSLYYSFSYLPGENLIRSHWFQSGTYTDAVYTIEDGKLVMLGSGIYTERPGEPQHYEWNDETVDQASYDQYLNELFDTSRAVSVYDQAEPMSYSEIVTAIENY